MLGISEDERLNEQAEFFKALGHPVRLKILKVLAKSSSQCVKNLGEILKISQPSISQHLAILRNRGIVGFKREGSLICYYIKDKRVYKILECVEGDDL